VSFLHERPVEIPRGVNAGGSPRIRVVFAAVAASGLLLPAARALADAAFSQPAIFAPVSTPALMIRDLAWLVLGICGAIFLLVGGLLAYAVLRFRARPGEPVREPAQVYGSRPIELAWTIVPTIIVFILFLATARSILDLQKETAPTGWTKVEVVGHQWWWEFRYPEAGVVTANELHLPVSTPASPRPTYFELESADVIHSFWVPQLAGKQDVVPNKHNGLWFEPLEPGIYVGQCAEFCGTQHAGMLIRVIVHPPGEFERWLESQRRPAVADSTVADGRAVFEQTACINCHRVSGTVADGRFGPDLTHLMSRTTIASGLAKNDRDSLRRWLKDPDHVKPGALMPAMQLGDHEIDRVVAYLMTLR
jgi:cytochrome c oxidase subunit 2